MIVGNFFIAGEDTKKPLEKGSSSNIIYFTNKCNLACTYCYEDLPGRPPQILTKEKIREIIDEVLEREDPNQQTIFVLFGGEPTLEWENVCYCMSYAYSKKKNVHFNMTSNGIKYLSQKFIDETKSNFFYKSGMLTIDISFDGAGNQDRIFHNGEDSTLAMLKVLKNLVVNGIKFRLRYTIQNHNIHCAYEDITRLVKTFNPGRVIISVAWDTLQDSDKDRLTFIKNAFRNDWINKDITVPICELFCDMCDGCGVRKEFKAYYSDEGQVNLQETYENSPKFQDFKEKGQT